MLLHIAFIDLTKVFDRVSRDGIFKVLPKIGCPPKLQSMIESFHTDMKGTVQFNDSFSEPFEIRNGVKQGCVLAPMFFGSFFGLLLKYALETTTEGIYFRTRSDGRLFNIARLRAKTKVRKFLIRNIRYDKIRYTLFSHKKFNETHFGSENAYSKHIIHCINSCVMLFADDAAVVAHTQEELQSLMDCFSQACKDFGLTISLKKTNVLGQDT